MELLPLLSMFFLLLPILAHLLITHRRRRLPPGPRPLPLLGSILELGDQPHRSLARLAKIHGPILSVRLGTVPAVVVSSPKLAQLVLQRHDSVFSTRDVPDSLGTLSFHEYSLIWLPPKAYWGALRRLCNNELFAPQQLDKLAPLRERKAKELVAHVEKLSAAGLPVAIGRAAFVTILNLLSCCIFSVDMADLDDSAGSQELKDAVRAIVQTAGCPNVSDLFPAVAPADLQGKRRQMTKLFRQLHPIFDEQIERRLRSRLQNEEAEDDHQSAAKNDFLDVLLDYKLEDGSTLNRLGLLSLFTELFVAGNDTTASSVEWAMAELLRSPSCMEKVQEELQGAIGSGRSTVEESDICKLPYLQAVVKETLRLHPPGPLLLPRKATEAVEMEGYEIPKGSRMYVNVWAIGRDEAVWEKAEGFAPERFLAGGGVDFRGRDFGLLPFGAGRRICPAIPLADRMVSLMLASLLHGFRWHVDGELAGEAADMREKFGITLTKVVPLRAMATPYTFKG